MRQAAGVAGLALLALFGLLALLGVWRLRWLTPGGVVASLLIGGSVLAGAGGAGLVLLLFFFVSSSLLTGLGRRVRRWRGPGERRTAVGTERRAGRSAAQVIANGGVAAAAALLALAGWLPRAELALVGALAAATADTWATELGTAVGGATRRLVDWSPVPPGTSGGVSIAGSLTGTAGALLCGAGAAYLLPGPAAALLAAGVVGGVLGALTDSWIGATLEGSIPWITNDVVNLSGTLVGGVAGRLVGEVAGFG